MLSEADNRRLTRVGPGTPMGSLLRRYWHPVAAALELDEDPLRPVRLLGEDLLLYQDRSGRLGLVERRCPHRGADLAYGSVDEHGVRCGYHGWRFDETGRCMEQPFEEAVRPGGFKDRVGIAAYRVEEKAGLLWAYLGPAPAPCLPDWARFHEPGRPFIELRRIPCNWLQCQENNIDPIHFEWLHENLPRARRGMPERTPRHLRLAFEETDFGFIYRRIREGTDESHPLWSEGRVCLWPHGLYTGRFLWHVPVDDGNTLDVVWGLRKPRRVGSRGQVPYRRYPLATRPDGTLRLTDGPTQDASAMIGQGRIADRTRERLGESDRGVVMLRRRLLADLERVAAGEDPSGLIRDPARNHRLPLPRARIPPTFLSAEAPLTRLAAAARALGESAARRVREAVAPVRQLGGAVRRKLARPNPGVAARAALGELLAGHRATALVHVLVKLGIPDALAGGPRPADELARAAGADAGALGRIMRALVTRGVLSEDARGFALTPIGHLLRSDVPGSLRGLALLTGEEYAPAWGGLLHAARTGRPAFDEVFGTSCWAHRAADPELDAAFNAYLAQAAAADARAAHAVHDFSAFATLVDVGGGLGTFLAELARHNPSLRGTLFEQPHVVARASAGLAALGLEVVTGSFFEAVPAGADAYLLRHVLHDWQDERALAILRVCRAAIPASGRLLVLEGMLPGTRGLLDLDVHMLAMHGGRERSEPEYRGLLADAGFRTLRSLPIRGAERMLEAMPV